MKIPVANSEAHPIATLSMISLFFVIGCDKLAFGYPKSSEQDITVKEQGTFNVLMEMNRTHYNYLNKLDMKRLIYITNNLLISQLNFIDPFAGVNNEEDPVIDCNLCSKCGIDDVITDLELVDNDDELEESIKIKEMKKLIAFCGKLADSCPECKHSWF